MSNKKEKKPDPKKVEAKFKALKENGMAIPVSDNAYIVAPDIRTSAIGDNTIKLLDAISKELEAPNTFEFNAAERLGEPFLNQPQNLETKALLQSLLPVQGKQMRQIMRTGSGIPYYTAMIGDMLLNPSTVDTLTFKKMMETDDVIFHALDYNSSSIVNSIGGYTHKNKDIEKLIRYTFKNLIRGFDNMIRDMNMAVGLGFAVISLKWEYDERVNATIIKDAYPLPQSTMVFRVEPDGHVREDGVGQYVYNAYLQNIAQAASLGWWRDAFVDPSSAPFPLVPSISLDPLASGGDMDFPFRIPWYSPVGLVWLQKRDVMIYRNYGTTAQMNPYGRSSLRAIYSIWMQTMSLQQFKMLALQRRSFPLLVVYCNQTTPVSNTNVDNLQQPRTKSINALQAAATHMSDINTVSTIFLPGMPEQMFKVEAISVDGNMDIFDKLEKDLNDRKKITLGVPPNIMASGDGASYAMTYIQGQSNSRIVASGRSNIVKCLLEQFVKPIIEENFTEEEHDFDWGDFEDEQISLDERLKNASLYQIAIDKGLAFPDNLDDLNAMREGIGMSRLTEKEFDEYKKETLDELKTLNSLGNNEASQKGVPNGGVNPPDQRDRNDMIEKPYEHRSDIAS